MDLKEKEEVFEGEKEKCLIFSSLDRLILDQLSFYTVEE